MRSLPFNECLGPGIRLYMNKCIIYVYNYFTIYLKCNRALVTLLAILYRLNLFAFTSEPTENVISTL